MPKPRRKPPELSDVYVTFRMTPSEGVEVRARADAEGLCLADWVRQSLGLEPRRGRRRVRGAAA